MKQSWRSLPPAIWALGIGSLFMDMSSELVHAVLPLFMATVLGSSMEAIGLVEGVAEATAAITKVFSGALSDRLGRRKGLLLFGYGLAAFTKPVFPLANSLAWVFAARFVDRLGKGIRGAPRDALVADITPPERRGEAYGLRQGLDSVGALLGPLFAVAMLAHFAGDLKRTMWAAVVPAFITVLVLWRYVREPEQHVNTAKPPLRWSAVGELPLRYWALVLLGVVFTLARFSEAFLVLRARDVGFALDATPLVMVAMNVVYAGGAYPAGWLADRMNARTLLEASLVALIVADGCLAWWPTDAGVLVGAALWGLHMALSQGLMNKLVADMAPAELRGTAFGLFNLAGGVALLLASAIAGALWQRLGAPATFMAGAGFALVCGLGLLAVRVRRAAR